ncbi:hypothetical protein GUI12_01010 [Anaplasmataceae bacterium AB001_6]|nr:hypothetical protein GUI12_01010 [Anaplasmataceae bacterium AB001_6]
MVVNFLIFFLAYLAILSLLGGILWIYDKEKLYKILLFIDKYSIFRVFDTSKFREKDSDNKTDMSVETALKILGFKEMPKTQQEVRKRFNQLIKANHPDKGGSDYLSDMITKAKDKIIKLVK